MSRGASGGGERRAGSAALPRVLRRLPALQHGAGAAGGPREGRWGGGGAATLRVPSCKGGRGSGLQAGAHLLAGRAELQGALVVVVGEGGGGEKQEGRNNHSGRELGHDGDGECGWVSGRSGRNAVGVRWPDL